MGQYLSNSRAILKQQFYGRNEQIIKTDQDCPFLEDLECADVVIANFSTTIEEAVSMEKYVILWGEGSRYSHIDNQYLNKELVYPVYSSEELYNTIKLLVQKLKKQH